MTFIPGKHLTTYSHGQVLTIISEKMYKDRFRSWNWRKNQSSKNKRACSPQDRKQPSGSHRPNQTNAHFLRVQYLLQRPNNTRNQELVCYSSQSYMRAQFDTHGWSRNLFTFGRKCPAGEEDIAPPNFYALETSLLYCMHHMRHGNVPLAYGTLDWIFNGLNGAWRPNHP
jgi:hypothetical protein